MGQEKNEIMTPLIFYDDTMRKSEAIREVIGDRGFADVVIRKKTLAAYYEEAVRRVMPQARWQVLRSVYEVPELLQQMRKAPLDARVLHCFADGMVTDAEQAGLTWQKLSFVEEPYRVIADGRCVAVMFPRLADYLAFLERVRPDRTTRTVAEGIAPSMPIDGTLDISRTETFIQCITGNFDARYFNSVHGDEITLVKSSTNRRKIRAEYTYYQLLPDDMKMWFVQPFDYQEDGTAASYRMEHLHITDLAIKWVHGAITPADFPAVLDSYFTFFAARHARPVSREEYRKTADALYVEKVKKRIAELKALPQYQKIAALLQATDGSTIDALAERYFRLKAKIEARQAYPLVSVIGHGDPCFANTLYHHPTQMMKFIDPRGALDEQELWTDPYYDVAKLSHSICGNYDFFNNGLFDIKIDADFHCQLCIDFDRAPYVKLFRAALEKNGYDYLTVRIYEASLFLSMLPLHIDNPHKVFGFLLNARDILEEVERDAQ